MSAEAGERGLTRGTCFIARRLESGAVAVLLCFLGVSSMYPAGFLGGVFVFFFPSNAQGLRHVAGSLASFTSLY